MRLNESTAQQKTLLRNYLKYWNANRALLLRGAFCARYPEQNFTHISSENEQKKITVLHGDMPFTYDGRVCDVFHNGDIDGLLVENATDAAITVDVFENFEETAVAAVEIPSYGILRVPVCQTGMLRIRKK